jgi:hypothetical protein
VPYWDWASESVLPDIVSTQETVTVTTPSSGSQEIKNPLYSYTFHPVYSTFGDGLPDEKTVRSTNQLTCLDTTHSDDIVIGE